MRPSDRGGRRVGALAGGRRPARRGGGESLTAARRTGRRCLRRAAQRWRGPRSSSSSPTSARSRRRLAWALGVAARCRLAAVRRGRQRQPHRRRGDRAGRPLVQPRRRVTLAGHRRSASAASAQVGSEAPRRAAADASRARRASSPARRREGGAERGDVAGSDEAALDTVGEQVGEVRRRHPTTGRPARSASATAVRVASRRRSAARTRRRRRTDRRPSRGRRTVHDDTSGEVVGASRSTDPARVPPVDVVAAGEVQRRRLRRAGADRIEQLEDALVAGSQLATQRTAAGGRAAGRWPAATAGRSQPGSTTWTPGRVESVLVDELAGERPAGGDHCVAAPVHEPIERTLHAAPERRSRRRRRAAGGRSPRTGPRRRRPQHGGAIRQAVMLSTTTTSHADRRRPGRRPVWTNVIDGAVRRPRRRPSAGGTGARP